MRIRLFLILLFSMPFICFASVSNNVPLDHWSYDAVDKLIGLGLVEGGMLSIKPVTRLEMAGLIAEAIDEAQERNETNEIILAIIDRLKKEFKAELIDAGFLDGAPAKSFIKPIEDPYFRFVYADKNPELENQRGDIFDEKSNFRAGFASQAKLFDNYALYIHPEYADSAADADDIDVVEAYGKIGIRKLEIEVGKDSLWWGPGYYGGLIMSNNAEPFKMVKVSCPHPIKLPWLLRYLGPFKSVWFLTKLEEDRTIPEAGLTGVRLNFKPHPACEIGVSRTIMFGGRGRPHVGFSDYVDMWRPQAEQVENNQLAGFDGSLLIRFKDERPVKSVKVYTELIGEDEATYLPAKWGRLFGVQLNDIFRTGRTDFRFEYASNHIKDSPDVFYTHNLYKSGYRYYGRIIGHHMGIDTRDLFFRVTHYLSKDLILGLEYDRRIDGLSENRDSQTTERYGCDLTFFSSNNWQLKTEYRYQDADGTAGDNHIFQFKLVYDF